MSFLIRDIRFDRFSRAYSSCAYTFFVHITMIIILLKYFVGNIVSYRYVRFENESNATTSGEMSFDKPLIRDSKTILK